MYLFTSKHGKSLCSVSNTLVSQWQAVHCTLTLINFHSSEATAFCTEERWSGDGQVIGNKNMRE